MTHMPARTFPQSVQRHPPLRSYEQACMDSARQKLRDGVREVLVAVELAARMSMPLTRAVEIVREMR